MRLYACNGTPARARKDERPNLNREGRIWAPVVVTLDGKELLGFVSTHWVYFEHEGQWYKLSCKKYELPVPKAGEKFELKARQEEPLTDEEKKLRKKLRRQARRAAGKSNEEEEDEDDE